MKRYKPNQSRAKKSFTKNAMKTVSINHPRTCPRGGIRL